jgi:hypothetical protein
MQWPPEAKMRSAFFGIRCPLKALKVKFPCGFRVFKIIMERDKSICGAGLNVEMLEHLMRISIEGPAMGTPVLNNWCGLK